MEQLDIFARRFSKSSICALAKIFETSKGIRDEQIIKELESDLLSVLQHEMSSRGFNTWEVSPKGHNHIIVSNDLCAIVNIYGINCIFENVLFFEGELRILNFHWIEDDNIVVFDLHYIVHDKWQTCICHFENTDFFVYFTPIVENEINKDEINDRNDDSIDFSLFEW